MVSRSSLSCTIKCTRLRLSRKRQPIRDGCTSARSSSVEPVVKLLKRRRSGSKTNTRPHPQTPILSFDARSAGKFNSYPLRHGYVLRWVRRPLATSQYLVSHEIGKESSATTQSQGTAQSLDGCAHYFVDPLSWMRPELEQGKLDGRLQCPKCKTNVGKYAWQGMQCSCGDWVVPGISLAKGRVDEVKSRTAGTASMGIRMPPSPGGRKSGPGQQNL